MARTLAIHVLPDSNPTNVLEMIHHLSLEPDLSFTSSKELVEYLRDGGANANDWVQSTSASMGILEKLSGAISLSDLGHSIAKIREDIRGDLLHFLLYTGWKASDPRDFNQSWGYRTCCDRFWAQGEVELTGGYLDRVVEEIITDARETFVNLNVTDFDEISFSRKSLTGVIKWLLALEPQVLYPNTADSKERTFRRRDFCPPELLVLALAWVLRDEREVTGVDILLTREKRDAICRACLLNPESFDRALDWAIPTFPAILSTGTSAGFYGRFIRLHKVPTIQDVVR